MPAIRKTVTMTANGTVENILSGSAFEFAPQAEEVEIAITASATAEVVADISFGPDIQIEAAPIAVEQVAGAGPKLPDNILVSAVAAPGDRLKVQLREVAGNTPTVTAQVFTKPL